jgi:hypothetical protein
LAGGHFCRHQLVQSYAQLHSHSSRSLDPLATLFALADVTSAP